MNKFELFSMIFYTLNHYWKDHRSDELGQFLSDMNPFLFDDIGSAIPEIYSQFCQVINTNLTIDNSFGCAIEYINSVDLPCVKEAFSWVEEPEFCESWSKSDQKIFEQFNNNISAECTYCNEAKYYSSRRSKDTGRMLAYIERIL